MNIISLRAAALIAALKADSTLAPKLVDVYDLAAPKGTSGKWITVGSATSRSRARKLTDGTEDLHCWDDVTGDGSGVRDLAGDVVRVLQGARLTLGAGPTAATVLCKAELVILSQDPDGVTMHAVLRVTTFAAEPVQ